MKLSLISYYGHTITLIIRFFKIKIRNTSNQLICYVGYVIFKIVHKLFCSILEVQHRVVKSVECFTLLFASHEIGKYSVLIIIKVRKFCIIRDRFKNQSRMLHNCCHQLDAEAVQSDRCLINMHKRHNSDRGVLATWACLDS